MFIYKILRKKFKFAISWSISISVVVLFGIMSGMGISTIRAITMFGLRLLGEVLGRIYDNLTAISTAGLSLMLWHPFVIFNSGFQMSFAAIIAITLLWPTVCNILGIKENGNGAENKEDMHIKRLVNKLKKSILFGLNIGIVMNPIIAYNYFQIPTYSFLLNLFVVPLMSVVIVSGMAGIGLACTNVFLGRVTLLPGCIILDIYTLLCKWVNKLPWANVIVGRPTVVSIIVYYVVLVFIIVLMNYARNKMEGIKQHEENMISINGRKIYSSKIKVLRERKINRTFGFVAFIAYIVINLIIYIPFYNVYKDKNLRITFLDVGQGDGILMKADDGTVIMVDGGSSSVTDVGKYRIMPFLKSNIIKKIDYAIVTHPDVDHISGINEMMEQSYISGIKIRNLVMPDILLMDEAYKALVSTAQKNGTKVLYISKGMKMKFGMTEINCIYPSADTVAEDRNDYSTVLSVNCGIFSMLLTGDISMLPESDIIDSLNEKYTLLKVAHHGSNYSTSEEFLKKVQPKISIISVGAHNLYGHPGVETLMRLKESNSRILRTDQSGGIDVITDGRKMTIRKTIR